MKFKWKRIKPIWLLFSYVIEAKRILKSQIEFVILWSHFSTDFILFVSFVVEPGPTSQITASSVNIDGYTVLDQGFHHPFSSWCDVREITTWREPSSHSGSIISPKVCRIVLRNQSSNLFWTCMKWNLWCIERLNPTIWMDNVRVPTCGHCPIKKS